MMRLVFNVGLVLILLAGLSGCGKQKEKKADEKIDQLLEQYESAANGLQDRSD